MIIDLRQGFGDFEHYKLFKFPDNSIKLLIKREKIYQDKSLEINVKTTLRSNDDIITLALVKDVIDRIFPESWKKTLSMTYMMYQQDDRLFDTYESYGLKVISSFINSLKFNRVYIIEPHSDKLDFINNVVYTSDLMFFDHVYVENNLRDAIWIIPDAGAFKKQFGRLKIKQHKEFLIANKTRDHNTGDIVTILNCKDLNKQTCFIVDDICLGGRTFIEISKKLKEKNAGKIILLITHGVFNNGVDHLKEYVDEIYTTDTICTLSQSNFLKIFKM